jgi:hypothetical protein
MMACYHRAQAEPAQTARRPVSSTKPRTRIGAIMQGDLIEEANVFLNTHVIAFTWKILGAIAVWIVGGWVIKLLRAALGRTLLARKVDPTLSRYAEASANVLLKLLLRRTARGDRAPAGARRRDPECPARSPTQHRDPGIQRHGHRAGGAAVLQQRLLLAGVLRHQPGDQRSRRHRPFRDSRAAPGHADAYLAPILFT